MCDGFYLKTMIKDDNYFMNLALNEAKKAYQHDEVPIGCVLVDENGRVIARAYNRKEELEDISAHAEILALRKAAKKRANWRLNNCSIYITLEPCLMCASAILQSRIKRVVFAAKEENSGAFGTHIDILSVEKSPVFVVGGIKEKEAKELIQKFFKEKR